MRTITFNYLIKFNISSAESEDTYKLLENLLVCLKHCSEEMIKTKGII